jgi:hypothetical protein
MVKIPTAADLTKVTPQQAPLVQVPAGAFGEQIAQAAEDLGSTAMQIGEQIKKQEDEDDAKMLDSQLSKRLREIEYGDGKDDPGFFGLQGRNAIDNHKSYSDRVEKALKDIGADARSRGSARMFNRVGRNRVSGVLDKFGSHLNSSRLRATKDASAASIEEAIANAAANAGNPVEIAKYIKQIREEALRQATREVGDSDENSRKYVQRQIKEAVTKAHVAVINNLLSRPNGGIAAKKYFDDKISEIDGNVRAALRDKVNTASVLGDAQTKVDTIVAGANLYEPDNANKARKDARAITNPEVRKAALVLVNQRIAEAKSEQVLKDNQLRDSAIAKIFGEKHADITLAERQAMMKNLGTASFLEKGPSMVAAMKAGLYKDPDPETTTRLDAMPDNKFRGVNLYDLMPKLGLRYNWYVAKQNKIKKAFAQGVDLGPKATSVKSDAIKNNKIQKVDQELFKSRFDTLVRIANEDRAKGDAIKSDELQKIADRLTIEIKKEGVWSDTGRKRAFDVPQKATGPYGIDRPGYVLVNKKSNWDNVARLLGEPLDVVQGAFEHLAKQAPLFTSPDITVAKIRRIIAIARGRAASAENMGDSAQ